MSFIVYIMFREQNTIPCFRISIRWCFRQLFEQDIPWLCNRLP
jgi:hypothetical protein